MAVHEKSGLPYINFSDIPAADYDAQVALVDDGKLAAEIARMTKDVETFVSYHKHDDVLWDSEKIDAWAAAFGYYIDRSKRSEGYITIHKWWCGYVTRIVLPVEDHPGYVKYPECARYLKNPPATATVQ